MKRSIPILVLVLCLGGLGWVAVRALRAQAAAGKGMPAYSVFSRDEHGLAAAYDVVRKFGFEPVALTEPIQNAGRRGVLFVVEPQVQGGMLGGEAAMGEAEAKAMLGWVASGNTLVLCGRHPTALHEALGVLIEQDPGAVQAGVHSDAEIDTAGGYTRGIDRLTVAGRDTLRAETGLPLWSVEHRPAAVLLPWGRGRVLVVADPSLLTRAGLARADNGLFLYNVCRLDATDGQVFFDEFHHGLGSESGFWTYLRVRGLHWYLLPIAVVVVMGCWAAAIRLGPAVPPPPQRRADAVDYASAMARIYERADVRRLLGRIAARDFLQAVTRHLRLRRTAAPAEVLAAWRKQHPDGSSRLERLLGEIMPLRDGQLPPGQVRLCVEAFDQFKQEVARGHRG